MAYDDIQITEENGRLRAKAPYNPLFASHRGRCPTTRRDGRNAGIRGWGIAG